IRFASRAGDSRNLKNGSSRMASTDASARVAPMTAKRESSAVDVKPPPARSPKDQSRPFIKPLLKSHRDLQRPPFDCVALVLQGGGALGAFQAGVYQGLVEANLHPDWVAGISIGAINAALIAGNAPEARLEKLARAHHGERRASTRLSGRRGGGRTLLGWRARLQHPAAMGGGGRYPPGHAHVPG